MHFQEHNHLHAPVLYSSFVFASFQQKKILSLLGQLHSASITEKKVRNSSYFKGMWYFIPKVLCSSFAAKYSLRKRGEKFRATINIVCK